MHDAPLFIGKHHIQWNQGVFHPHGNHAFVRIDKYHAFMTVHCANLHQALGALFMVACDVYVDGCAAIGRCLDGDLPLVKTPH